MKKKAKKVYRINCNGFFCKNESSLDAPKNFSIPFNPFGSKKIILNCVNVGILL